MTFTYHGSRMVQWRQGSGYFWPSLICWFRDHVPHPTRIQTREEDHYICRRCSAHGTVQV